MSNKRISDPKTHKIIRGVTWGKACTFLSRPSLYEFINKVCAGRKCRSFPREPFCGYSIHGKVSGRRNGIPQLLKWRETT